MKIRMGFVTNSSSSSFVIVFKRNAGVAASIQENESVPAPFKYLAIESINGGRKVSKEALRDFLRANYENQTQCEKLFRSHDFDTSFQPLTKEEWDEVDKKAEALISQISDDEDIYIVDQSDDTAEGSELEHEIFPNICLEFFNNH